VMAKRKLTLSDDTDFTVIIKAVKENFSGVASDERDGLWLGLPNGWVQIRKSNTEPIMRIYAEGRTAPEADSIAESVIQIVKKL